MSAFEFAKDTLSKMRLSQLRELARRVGVVRYSNMLRDQLVSAIQNRASRLDASEMGSSPEIFEAPETSPSSPVLTASVQIPSAILDPSSASGITSISATTSSPEASAAPELPSTPAWIELVAEGPQWATVRWRISGADRERGLAAGGHQLALRLTDVTDTIDGGAHRHTLQEVLVEAGASEWHLPVPLGDRDYRVELGYRTTTGGWYSLVVSTVVRMPAELATPGDLGIPFSLGGGEEGFQWLPPLAPPGIHERLYQQASSGRFWKSQGSEGFHEQGHHLHGAAPGGHLSGAGPWASGREASGAGMAPRQRSFWLVADAELIVYGATDPAATLTVGNERLPLAEDGTFSLHTTFPDGEQSYPIQALAADGEQKRSITLDFRRTTPHAKVNSKESAVSEWF